MIGGCSQQKMSADTFDFVCTTCAEDDKSIQAVKYCVECSGYCCQSCTDAHKKFPALKNHSLMNVNQGTLTTSKQSSVLEFPTERCRIHKAKVVDMYCEGHDVVGCYVCMAKDHKSCQESHIHSIPDMIDTIFKMSDCKQTDSLLKETMVSMARVSKSKDSQLKTLNEAKKEAVDKVNAFQKALEAILSKIAESSRQDVEAVYKELETEIMNEKHIVDSICEDLKMSTDKLNKPEGNRAQSFACTKIAQGQIKQANGVKAKHEFQQNRDVMLSFIPDQSLVEYTKALRGIGHVTEVGQQKHNLYKIKECRDITIELCDDSKSSNSCGCCLTYDNQLLVTDCNNKKLKRIDPHMIMVVDYCTLDSHPYGVCCVSKHEVAVACVNDNKIQFVSIHDKMTPTREIKMSHNCYGIAFKDGQLYVTDWNVSLYVYNMTGTLFWTISQDNAGNKLFSHIRHVTFNVNGDMMFVGGGRNGLVCFDGKGNYLSTINDNDLNFVDGVSIDGRGNVFVVGYLSENVIQFSENGNKLGAVAKQADGLQYSHSVCFHHGLKRMFVTMGNSYILKMYELE